MFDLNLQLFGGGGSSSGLGRGGGGGGEGGIKPYYVKWQDGQGKIHTELIYRKTQREADKWAIEFRKRKEVKKITRPKETTKEKAKKWEERHNN